MKHRLSVRITFAALALRLVAPLAAYAAPMPFIGDICSARGTASASADATPQAPLDAHLLSHCVDCPCGTSSLALPAAFVLPPFIAMPAVARQTGTPPARLARTILFPPPRGPASIVDPA